jgi:precorrin-6B methylase 2
MENEKKQSITGFKVQTYQVKKGKDTEIIKVVLQADIENVGGGDVDVGDVLKALWSHQASDTDIGLSLFVSES